MKIGFPASVSARLARTAAAAANSKTLIGPIRLTIVCAVLLATLVLIGSGLFLYNLHNRIRNVSEQDLSNDALVLARQIEQLFATVETVQTSIIDDNASPGSIDAGNDKTSLARHYVFMKLRDTVSGMPYVGSLAIIDAQGRSVNSSRQWPTPDNDSADREYFGAFQSNPGLTSFIGEPVRNRANGRWVSHQVRKISGPNGEFLAVR